MKLEDAKKKFPYAKVIECKSDGGEYLITTPDGDVVCALAIHVTLDAAMAGAIWERETCVDVFTPDTRGVEVVHFAKEGRATFYPMKYTDKGKRRDERGMHMVGVIRRPGGVK